MEVSTITILGFGYYMFSFWNKKGNENELALCLFYMIVFGFAFLYYNDYKITKFFKNRFTRLSSKIEEVVFTMTLKDEEDFNTSIMEEETRCESY